MDGDKKNMELTVKQCQAAGFLSTIPTVKPDTTSVAPTCPKLDKCTTYLTAVNNAGQDVTVICSQGKQYLQCVTEGLVECPQQKNSLQANVKFVQSLMPQCNTSPVTTSTSAETTPLVMTVSAACLTFDTCSQIYNQMNQVSVNTAAYCSLGKQYLQCVKDGLLRCPERRASFQSIIALVESNTANCDATSPHTTPSVTTVSAACLTLDTCTRILNQMNQVSVNTAAYCSFGKQYLQCVKDGLLRCPEKTATFQGIVATVESNTANCDVVTVPSTTTPAPDCNIQVCDHFKSNWKSTNPAIACKAMKDYRTCLRNVPSICPTADALSQVQKLIVSTCKEDCSSFEGCKSKHTMETSKLQLSETTKLCSAAVEFLSCINLNVGICFSSMDGDKKNMELTVKQCQAAGFLSTISTVKPDTTSVAPTCPKLDKCTTYLTAVNNAGQDVTVICSQGKQYLQCVTEGLVECPQQKNSLQANVKFVQSLMPQCNTSPVTTSTSVETTPLVTTVSAACLTLDTCSQIYNQMNQVSVNTAAYCSLGKQYLQCVRDGLLRCPERRASFQSIVATVESNTANCDATSPSTTPLVTTVSAACLTLNKCSQILNQMNQVSVNTAAYCSFGKKYLQCVKDGLLRCPEKTASFQGIVATVESNTANCDVVTVPSTTTSKPVCKIQVCDQFKSDWKSVNLTDACSGGTNYLKCLQQISQTCTNSVIRSTIAAVSTNVSETCRAAAEADLKERCKPIGVCLNHFDVNIKGSDKCGTSRIYKTCVQEAVIRCPEQSSVLGFGDSAIRIYCAATVPPDTITYTDRVSKLFVNGRMAERLDSKCPEVRACFRKSSYVKDFANRTFADACSSLRIADDCIKQAVVVCPSKDVLVITVKILTTIETSIFCQLAGDSSDSDKTILSKCSGVGKCFDDFVMKASKPGVDLMAVCRAKSEVLDCVKKVKSTCPYINGASITSLENVPLMYCKETPTTITVTVTETGFTSATTETVGGILISGKSFGELYQMVITGMVKKTDTAPTLHKCNKMSECAPNTKDYLTDLQKGNRGRFCGEARQIQFCSEAVASECTYITPQMKQLMDHTRKQLFVLCDDPKSSAGLSGWSHSSTFVVFITTLSLSTMSRL